MTAAPAPNPPYVPLWCKSNYSFLEGASHPEELVEACRRNGLPAMALTDRNGVYGIVRAHVQARQAGIHLIAGSQIGLRDGSEILLLAQNRKGYGNLCSLLTDGHLRSSKGTCAPGLDEVCGRNPGLIALWIGRAGPEAPGKGGPEPVLEQLKTAFGDRLYILLARHRRAEEILREIRLQKLAVRRARLPSSTCTTGRSRAPRAGWATSSGTRFHNWRRNSN